jgi:hypothetical protein
MPARKRGGGPRRPRWLSAWHGARDAARALGAREAVAALAVMAVVAGVVAAIHATNTAADAALLQASLNGQGAAAAERVQLLFDPIPSVCVIMNKFI